MQSEVNIGACARQTKQKDQFKLLNPNFQLINTENNRNVDEKKYKRKPQLKAINKKL